MHKYIYTCGNVQVCMHVYIVNTYPKQKWNVPDVWDIMDIENVTSLRKIQKSNVHKISNRS